MRTLIRICILLTVTTVVQAEPLKFGGEISLKENTPFSKIATMPDAYIGKEVATQAKVEKVCAQKGCWMEVAEGEHRMRVVFKDYGFFVKSAIKSETARLQGSVIEKSLSVKEQKHLLEDEGRSREEINKISNPKKVYQFVAMAVEVK